MVENDLVYKIEDMEVRNQMQIGNISIEYGDL